MRLNDIRESGLRWTGKLKVQFGSGEPYTLNWGTSDLSRPSFLYVPVPLSHIRSALRYLQNATGWYDQVNRLGGVGGLRSQQPAHYELYPNIGRGLVHSGEAHLTIAMAPEMGPDPERIVLESGLVAPEAGIMVPVHHTGNYKVMRAASLRDDQDPQGPLLVSEVVRVPTMSRIRTELGLSPHPQVPGVANYIPHITMGYLAKSYMSYMQVHGQQPQQQAG